MEFAKTALHDELRWARDAMVEKLDGLSEYDKRRPLTATGTNLLGLINHLARWEAIYLGDVFGRPFVDSVVRVEHAAVEGDDFWVPANESSDAVMARFARACAHADETINDFGLEAAGHVAWWPRPDVTLFNVIVHRIAETNRHAGHADILREQLDGRTGSGDAAAVTTKDQAIVEARFAAIEAAAKAAPTQ